MSSQALLDAIETAGKEELSQLEHETEEQVEEILAEAEKTRESRREAAYQEALRPVATERARRLHEAQIEALKITASARDQIAKKLLNQVEDRLRARRDQPSYKDIFEGLVEEAVQMLGEKEVANTNPALAESPRLEVDGRDEKLAREILKALSLEMEIAPDLETWGGVVVRSGDGRIVVTNTLEARLEQLKPHLGKFIS